MANYKLAQAPWQTQDASAIKLEKAPWESSGKPVRLGIPTIQEMHPDISALDRAWVTNFGSGNPLDTISYLQSKYPKMEVTTGTGGQIIMRNPGETEYKVLDPDTGPISADILRDVGDVGWDILSGLVTGAATAGAGLLGGTAGGLGAIPAAIGAGGVSSAGMEALRQAIGKGTGTRQEMSPEEIGISGAIGAASPLLMGTGASAKQIAKGIPLLGIAAPKAGSQAGVLRRVTDKTFYKTAGAMGGLGPNVIETFEKRYPQIKKMSTEEVSIIAEDTADALAEKLRKVEKENWQKFESSLKGSTDQIDISSARKAFDDLEQQATEKAKKTQVPADLEDVAAIKAEKDRIFPAPTVEKGVYLDLMGNPVTKTTPAPAKFDPMTALAINQNIGETALYSSLKPNQTSMTSRLAGMSDKVRQDLARVADGAYRGINAQIEDVAAKKGGAAARSAYKETVNLHREITPMFKNAQTTLNTLTGLDRKGRAVLAEKLLKLDKKHKTGLLGVSQDLQALMAFAKPALLPLSTFGTTSTSRTIPAALAGGAVGGYLGSQIEGGRGTGILGMGLGSFLGGMLGGPAAIKKMVQARLLAQKAGAGLRDIPYGMPTTGIPTALYGMSGGNQ